MKYRIDCKLKKYKRTVHCQVIKYVFRNSIIRVGEKDDGYVSTALKGK